MLYEGVRCQVNEVTLGLQPTWWGITGLCCCHLCVLLLTDIERNGQFSWNFARAGQPILYVHEHIKSERDVSLGNESTDLQYSAIINHEECKWYTANFNVVWKITAGRQSTFSGLRFIWHGWIRKCCYNMKCRLELYHETLKIWWNI
jgi:hypothetical protein